VILSSTSAAIGHDGYYWRRWVMLKKTVILVVAVLLVAGLLSIPGCNSNQEEGEDLPPPIEEPENGSDKPDLIIEHVGTPITACEGDCYSYCIRVKNIGNAPASGKLYISNTWSNEDLTTNHYSHGELGKWSKPRIAPGEVMKFIILAGFPDSDVEKVRFIVNGGKRIEESNYKNNTYELELMPRIHRQVTNMCDRSFTVSWFSQYIEQGYVRYGKSPDSLDNTAYDDRGEVIQDDAHHVTITGLSNNTTYYYEMVSGDIIHNDYCGEPYKVTTALTLEPRMPEMIDGKVYRGDNTTVAKSVIVYAHVYIRSTGRSQELSAVVIENGTWKLDIGSIRTPDYKSFYAYSDSDTIWLTFYYSGHGYAGKAGWSRSASVGKAGVGEIIQVIK